MCQQYSGLIALVGGAGSEDGISLAIVRRLGDSGANLIITGSSARIHDRAAQLNAEGYEIEDRAAFAFRCLRAFFEPTARRW